MTHTPVTLLGRLHDPADAAAWSQFVFLFTPLLLRWSARFGLQPVDAEDLVQTVFVALLRELPEWRYDPGRSFRAWLYSLAHNKYRDWVRSRKRAADRDRAAAEPEGMKQDFTADEAEHRGAILNRAVALVKAEFAPTTWAAFWETAVIGRPGREVAAELAITPNAVYLARGRVLRRLRETVSGLLD